MAEALAKYFKDRVWIGNSIAGADLSARTIAAIIGHARKRSAEISENPNAVIGEVLTSAKLGPEAMNEC